MMNRLRGRNLAHPGCLIGVTTGLIIGITLAGILAVTLNIALNILLWSWLGLTVVLGTIGWIVGSALSSKFPVLEENNGNETNADQPAS